MQSRTQTFIGSSSEGINVANAIKASLLKTTECQIWTEGIFLPGKTYIETLEKLLNSMDYAILVATPDDMLEKRDVKNFSMRDNVLLELGLFMAKLGRSRTYLITPEDKPLHIPSDLLGVTSVSYKSANSLEELIRNLITPCEKIIQAMHEAEKELSSVMRKIIIKRLLGFTNQVQKFILSVQSISITHLTDRNEFEQLKKNSIEQLVVVIEEYMDDLNKLEITQEANKLQNTINEAITNIPFPEEIDISQDEIIGGVFNHFLGKKSGRDQVKEKFNSLTKRYEDWWNKYGNSISKEINSLQNILISSL